MSADVRVIRASPEWAGWVAAELAPADRREAAALVGDDAIEDAIRQTIERALWARVAVERDGPIALFGLSPVVLLGSRAAPWALFTTRAARHGRAIARHSRLILAAMRQDYPELVNVVDARHGRAHRWLRWLGFELLPAVPVGDAGLPFHPFVWREAA